MTYTTWYLGNIYWYLLTIYLHGLAHKAGLGFLGARSGTDRPTPVSYKDDGLTRCHPVHCASERISIQLSIEEVLTTHRLITWYRDCHPDTALLQVR